MELRDILALKSFCSTMGVPGESYYSTPNGGCTQEYSVETRDMQAKLSPMKLPKTVAICVNVELEFSFLDIAPEKSSPYYQELYWSYILRKGQWCYWEGLFLSNSQSLPGQIKLDPKSLWCRGTSLEAQNSLYFCVLQQRTSSFPSPCPWPMTHLTHGSSAPAFSRRGKQSLHLWRGGWAQCAREAAEVGLPWVWILLFQEHNFGPAHIICVSGGLSLQCSTRCTLNTNCFVLLPEDFTYW